MRRVLLLDTAELLAPVEDWLREQFLPSLPAGTLIVLATRHAPGPRWRVDLGWAQEMRVVRLANLEPDAVGAFLSARGIPQADHPNVLATAYVKKGRTIVSLASWDLADATCRLKIDWNSLGLDGQKARIHAPKIEGFQEAFDVKPDDALLVPQGKGFLLVLEPG